jgi:hypothetical protein
MPWSRKNTKLIHKTNTLSLRDLDNGLIFMKYILNYLAIQLK